MPFLRPRERAILIWLSKGWDYPRIANYTKSSLAVIHVHCHNIRKKTGIHTTKQPAAKHLALNHFATVRSGLDGSIDLPPSLPVSPKQLAVLRMVAQGRTYPEIAQTLGMGQQTAQNHATEGCKRAGISSRTHHQRLDLIRQWLRERDAQDLADNPEAVLADPML